MEEMKIHTLMLYTKPTIATREVPNSDEDVNIAPQSEKICSHLLYRYSSSIIMNRYVQDLLLLADVTVTWPPVKFDQVLHSMSVTQP